MKNTTTTSATVTTSIPHRSSRAAFRPWWPWLLTAAAFPPSGLVAHAVAGRVDSAPAALFAGAIAGTGIGAAQWGLLRRRGVTLRWIGATAAGLSAGLAVGAALVSYRTDISSLVLMGMFSGLGLGIAQGITIGSARRALTWTLATAALWPLGWIVTTAAGINVDEQWVNFGATGCITFAFLQSTIVRSLVTPTPNTVQS